MAFSFQTANLAPNNNSDALFRAWGSGIATKIQATGIVQTADTGQINWTTVLTPNTSNMKRGYEIYRFDDALQATRPVFMRIDYGSSSGGSTIPQIWITVGTATDGAGNIGAHASFPNSFIGGSTTTVWTVSIAWQSTLNNPLWISSDDKASLCIAGWMNTQGGTNPTYGGGLLLVERTRDWDGAFNGEGVLVIRCAGQTAAVSQTLIIDNAAVYSQGNMTVGVPAMTGARWLNPASGMEDDGVYHLYPVLTGFTPQAHGPSKHVVAGFSGDLNSFARQDVSVYAVTGTYLALGPAFTGWEANSSAAVTGLFRVA